MIQIIQKVIKISGLERLPCDLSFLSMLYIHMIMIFFQINGNFQRYLKLDGNLSLALISISFGIII